MADTTVTSNIKINADTKQAQAELTGLQKATERLRTGAVPGLGAAFGSLSSQAITLSGGLGGLSGVLSLVGQSALFLNPILGSLALVGSAVAVMMVKKRTEVEETTKSLKSNADLLSTVIERNRTLKDVLEPTIALSEKQAKEQAENARAHIGFIQMNIDRLSEETIAERIRAEERAKSQSAFRHYLGRRLADYEIEAQAEEEYNARLEELQEQLTTQLQRLSDAEGALERYGQAEKEAADAAKKHADQIAQQIARLNERNDIILMDERIALENRTQQAIMRTMTAEAQLAALRTKTTFENTDQIQEAFAAQRDAEMALFDKRLETADQLAGEQFAIEADRAVKMEQLRQSEAAAIAAFEKKKADDAARSAKLQMNWYGIAGIAFQKMIAGQLKGQRGFAAFFVEMTGEAISAALKAYALLWTAEATANAITNPTVAASKAKAAAMAGAAAGVVSAAASAAAANILATGAQDQTGELAGGAEATAMGGRTRQLVARGPINLTFYAPFTVQGHVMGIDDVHAMWLDWNEELLIQAGIDASKEY